LQARLFPEIAQIVGERRKQIPTPVGPVTPAF
jgi:hypothetical protein